MRYWWVPAVVLALLLAGLAWLHPYREVELSDLAPIRLGRASRFAMGMTITHIRKVADIGSGP